MLVRISGYSDRTRFVEVRAPLPDQLFLVSHGKRLFELSHDEAGRPCYVPQHHPTRPRWLERALARHAPPPPSPPSPLDPAPLPPGVYIDPRVYREGPNFPQERVSYWMPARGTGVDSAKAPAPKRAQHTE